MYIRDAVSAPMALCLSLPFSLQACKPDSLITQRDMFGYRDSAASQPPGFTSSFVLNPPRFPHIDYMKAGMSLPRSTESPLTARQQTPAAFLLSLHAKCIRQQPGGGGAAATAVGVSALDSSMDPPQVC